MSQRVQRLGYLGQVTLAMAITLGFAPVAYAARGVVTHRIASCDYFVVQAPNGYAVLEWYGGSEPDKGDIIVGDFEAYGMKDVFNLTSDTTLTVWVDDFYLSSRSALEKLVEQCQ